MPGLHLQQLHTACLGLSSAFNTALQTAELTPLTAVTADPPSGSPACPYLVVTLSGWRRRDPAAVGDSVLDTVWAVFRLETDQGENDALAYEGIVAGVLRGARATVAAQVTDASLAFWRLDRSQTIGGSTWTSEVKVRVGLEW